MLNQTYKDIDIIVADNASTDETSQFVSSIKDSRLKYIRRLVNLGDWGNYADIIKNSQADFLFITHDDDLVDPDYIERCMASFMADREVCAIGTNVRIIDGGGKVVQPHLYDLGADLVFEKASYVIEFIKSGFWIPPSTVGLRWSSKTRFTLIPKDRKFKENPAGSNADVFLICLLNLVGKVKFIGQPLASYREHGNQMSMKDNFTNSISTLYAALERLHKRRRVSSVLPMIQEAKYTTLIKESLLTEGSVVVDQMMSIVKKWLTSSNGIHHSHFLNVLIMLLDLPFQVLGERDDIATSTDAALLRWAGCDRTGKHGPFKRILSDLPAGQVAIFGSMPIAALLSIDALNRGIQISAFLDGNKSRQGQRLHGIEIVPHSWLSNHPVDYVMVSSEKDKFESVKNMLTNNTGTKAKILYWKEELDQGQ